jgi:alkanesulfonate monooxygenase SsuD/methylene tetrahydromethanopterin reductase-like flavin-dependent oxidoreductase (luciferase family)
MRIGLLLPHFSDFSNRDRLIGFAPRIEELGFDSVWVRDNLSYTGGHAFDPHGNTFVDPFITLAAVAGRTSRVGLGTAVVIPFRHPLVTAQLFGSLNWVAPGRVEVGLGPGDPTKPFELVGIDFADRIELCKETADVLRVVAREREASYEGKITKFTDAKLDPAPPEDLVIWYGGASNASVRRVLEYCDGILPGRCPFRRYDQVLEKLRSGAAEIGKIVHAGTIPHISIASTYEEAVRRIEPSMPGLFEYLSGRWRSPYATFEDVRGAVMVGTPASIVEQLDEFRERGVDLVVLDARLDMPLFEEVVEMIGEFVLPTFAEPHPVATEP